MSCLIGWLLWGARSGRLGREERKKKNWDVGSFWKGLGGGRDREERETGRGVGYVGFPGLGGKGKKVALGRYRGIRDGFPS